MQVTGPISSLPGSRHAVPKGQVCDHSGCQAPAVIRIQGETDSMGSEMHDLCLTHGMEMEQSNALSGECDWCHQNVAELVPTRSTDEGSCGPVYYVCRTCHKKQAEQDRAEYEAMRREEIQEILGDDYEEER